MALVITSKEKAKQSFLRHDAEFTVYGFVVEKSLQIVHPSSGVVDSILVSIQLHRRV